MLRAWDALSAGADRREIARELLSLAAGESRWRSRQSSVRSQAQRLVRSARAFAAEAIVRFSADSGFPGGTGKFARRR